MGRQGEGTDWGGDGQGRGQAWGGTRARGPAEEGQAGELRLGEGRGQA